MNKWLPVFLCCFAANAFASSADSGRCPWKIPFTIIIHANGSLHKYAKDYPEKGVQEKDIDFGTTPSTDDFEFTIDTFADLNDSLDYSLTADTLRFSYQYYENYESTSILIAFAPGKDSIISLTCIKRDSMGGGSEIYEEINTYAFQISSLLFDDTAIYTSDSSFTGHGILATDNEMQLSQITSSAGDSMRYAYDNFTASSVDLSGIFRPTHFAHQSLVVEAPPQTSALSVIGENGMLHCTFGASEEGRELEIYSPLGIRIASVSITAGRTDASLTAIPSGLYFVRLGNSVVKVFVAR